MIIRNSFRSVLSSFHRITASRQLLAITIILLGFNACYNEPNILGGDLIPSGDKTSVQTTDTFSVAAYTIRTDTLITSNYPIDRNNSFKGSSSVVLGCYNDKKIFGSIKAGFYTRIYQYNEKDSLKYIAVRPHADSLILKLKLQGIWGENNKSVNVRVYRLTGKMDSIKYNNGLVNPNISYHPTQVNEPTVYSGEDTLKIKFTQAFADTLMNVDTSTLGSKIKFVQFMKGLYFTIDSYSDPKGVLYSFANSGSFTMHYMKPTSSGQKKATYSYAIGYFNYFQHDSTTADPALRILSRPLSSITDNTPQDTVFGIEGFGGVRGLIKLKGAKEWKKLMPIAIHRAELRFDIQEHSELPSDSTIKQLYFYSYRSYSSETNVVTEHPLFAKYDNSSYNKAKSYYSIDVTLQLQELLKGKINRDYIIVEPFNVRNRTSSDASAPRDNYMQGLYRTGNNSKPIKLIVTYSKL
ncbi:MAG: hypothetical protein EHM93_03435 [Bacteroidales bacterium]|nr:MAG: hypothetical protein EHM93_03435 [Bacteroidales bacterium]